MVLDNGSGRQELRGDVGFDLSNPAGSFVRTVREVLSEPANFFRRLSNERDVSWSPVVFAIICALISAPLALLVAPYDPLAGSEAGFEGFADLFPGVNSSSGIAWVGLIFLVFLILTPLSVLLGLFIGAAVIHILVWIFVRPAGTGFYTTLLVVAYTSATTLLEWIPVIGLLASLYGLYLTFVGIREMHETTTGRALAVTALPVALFVVGNVLPLFPREA